MAKNLYDSVCENFGFSFKFTNGYLGRSKPIDPSERNVIEGNSDNLFVFCGKCNEWMEFHESGIMDGFWSCSKCGIKVKEERIYKKLSDENDANPYNEYY